MFQNKFQTFHYTYNMFKDNLRVTLTKRYKNKEDSSKKVLCLFHVLKELSIFHYTCAKNRQKVHGHVLETRDACGGEERRTIRPDRLSLSLISGPSDRSRPIDLSRARRRTHGTHARHARHATRTRNAITRRRRTRNSNSRSGKPSVLHPQPPIEKLMLSQA